MRIGDFGARLERIILAKYTTVAEAVSAMKKAGFDMPANQIYELLNGQWPKRSQLIAICDFFDVSIGFLLLGDEFEAFYNLNKEQQIIIMALIKQFEGYNKKLSPPPHLINNSLFLAKTY